MRIGSLFSGYGGLDLAVEAAFGATTAWVSDIDAGANKILAHRFPHAPNLGDITTVGWTAVEPVDVICGGSPCQDLSHAGRRAGMTDGTRSNTWVNMREAIATIRPTYVIWENVRGAFSAAADSAVVVGGRLLARGDGGVTLRALGRVLGDLSDLGYDTEWRGLRAADVGACHGRFRVFVVARLADTVGERGLERWVAGPGEAPGGRAPADDRRRDRAPLTLLPTPRATDGTKGGPNQRGSSGDLMLPSAVTQLLPTPMTSDAKGIGPADFERNDPQMRAVATELAHGRFGPYSAAVERHARVFGRPAPDPTEPRGRDGAHRLSPRFTEWMMGVPDGWITDVPGLTPNEALRACGNGVVPLQAHAAVTDCLWAFARDDLRAVAS